MLRYPFRPFDEYADRAQKVMIGDLSAKAFVASHPFPGNAEDFLSVLKGIHDRLFRLGMPDIAGRFRAAADGPIGFGGEGRHALVAIDPSMIVPRLLNLYSRIRFHTSNADQLAHEGAEYFEEFFRIHPFVDGNGRVARHFFQICVSTSQRFCLGDYPADANSRRKYIKALQYAHGRRDADLVKPGTDPFCFLARWLRPVILPKPKDEDLEEADPPAEAGRQ